MPEPIFNSRVDLLSNFGRVWRHLSARRKIQLYLLVALTVLASVVEVFSIGALVPFMSVLISPEEAFENPLLEPVRAMFQVARPTDLIGPVSVIFCIGTIASGCARYLLLFLQARISYSIGADLSVKLYERTLYQPYLVHISRNSSSVIAGVSVKANELIVSLLYPVTILVSSFLMLSLALAALVIAEPVITLGTVLFVSLTYLSMSVVVKSRLGTLSRTIAVSTSDVVRLVQEGLGGIRDILLDGTQHEFVASYRRAEIALRASRASLQVISGAPRFFIETAGTLLIVGFALNLALDGKGVASAVPLLGVLALGAQRLLPIVQQGYSAWAAIEGGRSSVNEAIELLEQPLLSTRTAERTTECRMFSSEIEFVNVSFSYSSALPNVLNNVNLRINKGDRLGVIGSTGSGKSTFLDLVMALVSPTTGRLYVDGQPITLESTREWQQQIAHVPQAIYLSDSSIAENIAFGTRAQDIDYERVAAAARVAQLDEFIQTLSQGYSTKVGERGVRLSGGQRQRIGIARALYKRASVIILDEATSALDVATERAVMDGIHQLPQRITLVIVAHRTSTLLECTRLVEIKNGAISPVDGFPQTP